MRLTTVCSTLFCATALLSAEPAARPNILLIVADDLGWGDLSCHGQTRWKTPNLDRLAAQGTRFAQAYMSSAVCSPSRATLMTGRWPAELRIHGHFASPEWNAERGMVDALDPQLPTVADTMAGAGYRTIHVGKWHLGPQQNNATRVAEYGFGEVYWPNCAEDGVGLWKAENRPHATQTMVDTTLRVLASDDQRPFYCQLWLNDPHAELAPSDEQMAPFLEDTRKRTQRFTTPYAVYAATITEMDRALGMLLSGLEQRGLDRNTLVVFTSDNGPEDIEIRSAAWSAAGSAGPLRGRKRSIYEGGTRVPFIVRWPGQVPAGAVDNNSIISAADWMPTCASLAGATLSADTASVQRGESVVSALRGQPFQRSRPLLWEWREEVVGHPWNSPPRLAIREGRWKLLMNPDRSRVELYDIPADPGERDNRARDNPEVVERLAATLLAWHATLPAGRVDPRAGRDEWNWPAAQP